MYTTSNGARCGEYRLSYWGAAWLARRRRRTAQASAHRLVVLDRTRPRQQRPPGTCPRRGRGVPHPHELLSRSLELRLPALSARPLLQRVHPCSGPCQSCSSWGCSGVLGVPRMVLDGSRNVLGGQDLNSIEWSTGFEFLTVSSMPPAPFRCQLNRQRQSRHRGGPGRTLVCIQRTPSARATPPPT